MIGIQLPVMELIKRGDVYWVKLDPIEGHEVGKTSPALVISNDINNELADILPITSSVGKVYPFEVFLKQGIGNISIDSKVKTNQIRTVDKNRLKERIGTLPGVIVSDVEKAVKIHLELR